MAGLGLSKDAQHQGAVARLRALDDCLSRFSFAGHEKKARQRIEDWQKQCESRTFLAHAKLKAAKCGITIEPINLAPKKEVATPPKALTRIEMLEFLAELERAQMLLHQQLGHIKAKAAEAKPKVASDPSSSRLPDPASSPG